MHSLVVLSRHRDHRDRARVVISDIDFVGRRNHSDGLWITVHLRVAVALFVFRRSPNIAIVKRKLLVVELTAKPHHHG
jgi:hypothetical protein